jgi:hypothetical protein
MTTGTEQPAGDLHVRFTESFWDSVRKGHFPDEVHIGLKSFEEDKPLLCNLRGSGTRRYDSFAKESYVSYEYNERAWLLVAGEKELRRILQNPARLADKDGVRRLQIVFKELGVEPLRPFIEYNNIERPRAERWALLRPLIFVDCFEGDPTDASASSVKSSGTTGERSVASDEKSTFSPGASKEVSKGSSPACMD